MTSSRAPARAYIEAYERIAGEPFQAWLARTDATAEAGTLGDGVRARVLIRPKAGILDPQGEAVERALPALGFEGVANVHVGRLVELDVEDPAQRRSRCASSCSRTRWSRTTRSSSSTASA